MTRRIVFIDPGASKPCAVAWFFGTNLTYWCPIMAYGAAGMFAKCAGDTDEAYFEIPAVRGGSGVDPAHIVALAAAGAWVAGALRPLRTVPVPVTDWKGKAAKPQVHGRIYAQLTVGERALLPANTPLLIDAAQEKGAKAGWPPRREWYLQSDGGTTISDALDAIGGGLWVLGRLREKSGKASPYVNG